MSKFHKVHAAALLAGALIASSCPANAQLKFEVHKPFRFFKHQSDYAVQRIAFDLLVGAGRDRTSVTVEDLEKRLADPSFWHAPLPANARALHDWPLSWGDEPNALAVIKKLRAVEQRVRITSSVWLPWITETEVVTRFGWAALLDTHLNGHGNTAVCWNQHRRLHSECGPGYLSTRSWEFRVFLPATMSERADKLLNVKCLWEVYRAEDRKELATRVSLPCAEAIVPIAANNARGESSQGSAFVVRKNVDGSETKIKITMHDRLVVGLGDSFASGEGNPDRPVVFDRALTSTNSSIPRRPGDEFHYASHWIDRSCHRSAYSWQIRSTLHQTLVDPANAVTLLGYACSGAEVMEGLLYTWRGTEPSSPQYTYTGQLAAVYNELCEISPNIGTAFPHREELDSYLNDVDENSYPWAAMAPQIAAGFKNLLQCPRGSAFKRPLNAVLLSVGGNDLGFSKWIAASILVEGVVEGFTGGFIPRLNDCDEDRAACELTKARIQRLTHRYDILREVLVARLLKDGKLSPDKLLVTGYLKATFGSNGQRCPAGNAGMTISVFPNIGSDLFAVRKPSELGVIETFRESQLMRLVKRFADGPANDFTLVHQFIDEFKLRGFCASADPDEHGWFTATQLLNLPTPSNTLQTLHMPRMLENGNWRPFGPDGWRPYASRQRLLRTPNDAFMTVNNKPGNTLENGQFGLLDLRHRAQSGAFHPTAEAHSIIAKHVAGALAKALKAQ